MSSHPPAYAVPFRIDRRHAPRLYHLVHVGAESVRGLRVCLAGPGYLEPVFVPVLVPGQSVALTVIGVDLGRSTVAVVSWLRPSGDEFFWRFSF